MVSESDSPSRIATFSILSPSLSNLLRCLARREGSPALNRACCPVWSVVWVWREGARERKSERKGSEERRALVSFSPSLFFWGGSSPGLGRPRNCIRQGDTDLLSNFDALAAVPMGAGGGIAMEGAERRRVEIGNENLFACFRARFEKKPTKFPHRSPPNAPSTFDLLLARLPAQPVPSNGLHDAPLPRGRGEARSGSIESHGAGEENKNANALVAPRDDRCPALRPDRLARAVPRRRGAAGRGVLPLRFRHRQGSL